MAPPGGHADGVRPPAVPGRDQRLSAHLTVEQRLDWLQTRIGELRLWIDREWVELTDWTFDGAPLGLGAPWPVRPGVHELAHPHVEVPWPDARLELDLGAEGLLTLAYADGVTERFGLDAEHAASRCARRRSR
jgi:alpha-mannosidase